jgi:hypothetical protein
VEGLCIADAIVTQQAAVPPAGRLFGALPLSEAALALPAIRALGLLPRFVARRHGPLRSGRRPKLPINPRTGWLGSVPDPRAWAPLADAQAFALSWPGYGVGLVLVAGAAPPPSISMAAASR